MKRPVKKGHIFFGIVVIALGILFLLRTLNLVALGNVGELLQWVPSLLILWGLILLVARRFRRIAGPIALIVIGALVQVLVFDVFKWDYVWPVVIILIGIALISRAVGGRGDGKRRRKRQKSPKAAPQTSSDDSVNISVTMGEANQRNRSKDFRGGEISSVMGQVTLDLTDAEIVERPARIHIDVVMAGVDILVPDHWSVESHVETTMAEVDNHAVGRASADPDDQSEQGLALLLSGSMVMGHLTVGPSSPAEDE